MSSAIPKGLKHLTDLVSMIVKLARKDKAILNATITAFPTSKHLRAETQAERSEERKP
ncbi:MAG: hypothetical protein ABSE82_12280 [Nitrososphaerales archaeon]